MDRNWLNERLLTEAGRQENVEILFGHKLLKCDVVTGVLTFLIKGKEENVNADIIIGADGVYSQVRVGIMRAVKSVPLLMSEADANRMDFSQVYIDCTWCELEIPAAGYPTEWGGYKMIPERLHIWPRGNFMLIALPNNVSHLFIPSDRRINRSLAHFSSRRQ